MNPDKIGKFIFLLRKENNLTQAELGKLVGVSSKAVSKWERGLCIPESSKLDLLASTLHTSSFELLNGERLEKKSDDEINKTLKDSILYYDKISKHKLYKCLLIFTSFFLILLILFLNLYFFNNYGKCTIYEFSSLENQYNSKGNLILTNNQMIFSLSNIDVPELMKKDISSYYFEYSLYIDDILLLKNGNVELYEKMDGDQTTSLYQFLLNFNAYIKNDMSKKIMDKNHDLSSVELLIKYIDENDTIQEYSLDFPLKQIYTNNKIIYHHNF